MCMHACVCVSEVCVCACMHACVLGYTTVTNWLISMNHFHQLIDVTPV